MAASIIGLDKVLKKLDKGVLTGPAQKIVFNETAGKGASFLTTQLSPRFPITARSVNVVEAADSASIRWPRYPQVFHERGSQYPTPKGTRRHRKRTGVKTSALRIKPTRHQSKTRSQIRRTFIPSGLDKAAQSIEKVWAS